MMGDKAVSDDTDSNLYYIAIETINQMTDPQRRHLLLDLHDRYCLRCGLERGPILCMCAVVEIG